MLFEWLKAAGISVMAAIVLVMAIGAALTLVAAYIMAIGSGFGLAVRGFCWASGLC